jgi:hypothetical protein
LFGRETRPPTDAFSASGSRRARDTLLRNLSAANQPAIADLLLEIGDVVSFAAGEVFIEVDRSEDEVYFILDGEGVVELPGRRRRSRKAPTQVGEMAALDRGSRRSATVRAGKGGLVALRVEADRLNEVFEAHPEVRERMRSEMADRQRELIAEGGSVSEAGWAGWTILSVVASLIVAGAVFGIATWTDTAMLPKIGFTATAWLVTLLTVHSRNPAFFWRRMIGGLLILAVGVVSMQRSVSLETTRNDQTFRFGIDSDGLTMGDGTEIAVIVVWVFALAIFSYFEHRRMERS